MVLYGNLWYFIVLYCILGYFWVLFFLLHMDKYVSKLKSASDNTDQEIPFISEKRNGEIKVEIELYHSVRKQYCLRLRGGQCLSPQKMKKDSVSIWCPMDVHRNKTDRFKCTLVQMNAATASI